MDLGDSVLTDKDINSLLKAILEPFGRKEEIKEQKKEEPICPNFGKGQRKLNQEEIDKLISIMLNGDYPNLVIKTFTTILDEVKKVDESEKEEREDKMDNKTYFSNKVIMALATSVKDYEQLVENSPTKKLFSVGRKIVYENKIAFHFWFDREKQIPTNQELNYLKHNLPLNHNFIFVGGYSSEDNFYSVSYRNSSDFPNKLDLSHFFRISSKIIVCEELSDALKDIEDEYSDKDELVASTIGY